MIVSAWIILVLFGVFALRPTFKWLIDGQLGMNTLYATFFSYIMIAISAGIIFGGLFKQFNI